MLQPVDREREGRGACDTKGRVCAVQFTCFAHAAREETNDRSLHMTSEDMESLNTVCTHERRQHVSRV